MARAHDYLIKQFADDAGAKAGEFFTPPEVVDTLVRILAPFAPETAALQAGRVMLQQRALHAAARVSFAFETTLSGRGYLRLIDQWQRCESITNPACSTHHASGLGLPTLHRPSTHPGDPHDCQFPS